MYYLFGHLCTKTATFMPLLQGYRVEYVAAADALTYAPESFHEFFNQRRRWGPSTMANILDLLFSWKRTVKLNDNISRLYMLYQALIFASSILGPATIVLMLTGAFNNVSDRNFFQLGGLHMPLIAFKLDY